MTHLVLCTCTGFFAPGPDMLLLRRLGLRSSVSRMVIGFMGCHGGFNGIRAADQIVRADPEAVVLLVSVELCSLHYQKRPDPGFVVSSSLFANGCAAAVLAAPGRRIPGLADILGTATHAVPDSLESMTWRIGDTGFEMVLNVSVPAALAGEAAPFVADLLRRAGLERSEIRGWAIHPGGRKILNALALVLGLENRDLRGKPRGPAGLRQHVQRHGLLRPGEASSRPAGRRAHRGPGLRAGADPGRGRPRPTRRRLIGEAMPDLSRRVHRSEIMEDPSIPQEEFSRRSR